MNNATCKPVVNNFLSKFKIYNVNQTNKYRLFDADILSLFFALPTSMHIFIDKECRCTRIYSELNSGHTCMQHGVISCKFISAYAKDMTKITNKDIVLNIITAI